MLTTHFFPGLGDDSSVVVLCPYLLCALSLECPSPPAVRPKMTRLLSKAPGTHLWHCTCLFVLPSPVSEIYFSPKLWAVDRYILGWPKISFAFVHNILWKNPNKLFGQPNRSRLIDRQTDRQMIETDCWVSCSVTSNSLQPHGLQPTRLLCP